MPAHPSTRQVLLQKRASLKLNPITTLYYVAPCCLGFLVLPWAFLEAPRLLGASHDEVAVSAWVLLSNGGVAFALNLVRLWGAGTLPAVQQ